MSVEAPFEPSLDMSRARRYVNADPAVILSRGACALMEEIAEKTCGARGAELLEETMEDVFYRALKWTFLGAQISKADKKTLIEQYFRLSGLGRISIQVMDEHGGRAEYGRGSAGTLIPAACIRGYLAGAFAAAAGRVPGSFAVGMGVPEGLFTIEIRR